MQQQTVRRPGRPRDPNVIARDEAIFQLIADGHATRAELAARTGLDRALVQLACQRLHRAGRIRQCLANGAVSWSVADGTPCS
ncbi:winged helix-turn-helix transcriptional regulator [Streptomyces sp. NPDC093591]|uniref:winged helix-turn-helix transcriptional regulator n=1 Tax=Streptomyces sp. NPDC093591 TaxID=3366044 RepID=UPI0037FA2C22